MPRCRPRGQHQPASAVPDVLAPGLACVFCGINPGRVSAAAAAHFANPRNDFWRLLHDAGFTPRLFEPQEQFELLELGYGVTNAAYRTTPGSGDLRRGDFDARRVRGADRARSRRARSRSSARRPTAASSASAPSSGRRCASIGRAGLFVLPSTSPANAAVPYDERVALVPRAARLARAASSARPCARSSLDADDRVLLVRFRRPVGDETGGGRRAAASSPARPHEQALRRELREEIGLEELELGPFLYEHVGEFSWARRALPPAQLDLSRPCRRARAARHDRPRRRRASPRCAGGRSTSSRRPREQFAPADLVERRAYAARVTAVLVTVHLARRRHLVRRLDRARLRRRAGDPDARRRAARAGDARARPPLAAARLRRAARRSADRRRARRARLASTRAAFQIVLWVKVALFCCAARRLVPAQLRARPAPAGRDPRGARAAHAAARSSSSAGSATR